MSADPSVLLVDDEEAFLATARLVLKAAGFGRVECRSDSREVLPLLEATPFDIVALDVTMPHLTGLELLERISARCPSITVVMITGNNDVGTAVTAMKLGAFDYIVKPVNRETLLNRLQHAVTHHVMKAETSALRDHLLDGGLRRADVFSPIITRSAEMHRIFAYLEAVAPTGLPILVSGPTGTGKELIARAIHQLTSPQAPFVAVNVAGLDDSVFADTLFGHLRGAFTGADRERRGLVEEAAGGTLFLDEIGNLRPDPQVKLLRLLQEGEYYPVGSDAPRQNRARIIAATNLDIAASPDFRRDLYYRLQAHRVDLPPLSQRMEDIPLLIAGFADEAARSLGLDDHGLPDSFIDRMCRRRYEGNVRELRSIVFEAVSMAKAGMLDIDRLAGTNGTPPVPQPTPANAISFPRELPTVRQAEDALIAEALRRSGNNRTLAARTIGITRQTLISRLKERGVME